MVFIRNELRNAIEAVKPALSDDVSEPILTGIHFKFSKGVCRLTACNDYMFLQEHVLYSGEDEGEFIIPYINIKAGNEYMRLEFRDKEAVFDYMEGTKFSVPVIKGKYVNVDGAKPKGEPEFSILINPRLLENALKKINLQSGLPVRLTFYGEYKPVVITPPEESTTGFYKSILPCCELN